MAKSHSELSPLSDQDLIAEVKVAAACERNATVLLIALLAQLDERRLYLGEGCSSLFTYCTQVLHLPEHAAYGRIEAARAARKFPVVLDLLANGSLTLTAVTLLAAHEVKSTAARLEMRSWLRRARICLPLCRLELTSHSDKAHSARRTVPARCRGTGPRSCRRARSHRQSRSCRRTSPD